MLIVQSRSATACRGVVKSVMYGDHHHPLQHYRTEQNIYEYLASPGGTSFLEQILPVLIELKVSHLKMSRQRSNESIALNLKPQVMHAARCDGKCQEPSDATQELMTLLREILDVMDTDCAEVWNNEQPETHLTSIAHRVMAICLDARWVTALAV